MTEREPQPISMEEIERLAAQHPELFPPTTRAKWIAEGTYDPDAFRARLKALAADPMLEIREIAQRMREVYFRRSPGDASPPTGERRDD